MSTTVSVTIDDMPRPASQVAPELELSCERMLPECSEPITFWEHICRYRFATKFVRGRRVLDIACGEGYGTQALLRAGAWSVVGVDVSEAACAYARNKYGIDARCGNAEDIPLPSRSVDVVVSFETIEHLRHPARFVDEVVRVLTPNGLLVISTPNKSVFNAGARRNPFHCSEMDEQDFVAMLGERFAKVRVYVQRPHSAAWWSPMSFVADSSAWRHVRGYWRLRKLLCPDICGDVPGRFRESPAEAVLTREHPFARLVNPFAVRRKQAWHRALARYVVAVAQVT